MGAKRKRTRRARGVSSLPEDIVFDVLARLPAKTLCRFRCVCKAWSALISDPAFVAAQRSRAADDPHLVGVFLSANREPEVRVMDMDGNVVRAFEFDITRSSPLPLPLPPQPDVICADGTALMRYGGGMIIDPAAGRVFAAAFGTTDPAPYMVYSTSLGRANPSGVFKVLRLQGYFLRNSDDVNDDFTYQLISEVSTVMDSGGGAEPLTWRRTPAPPFSPSTRLEHKAIVNGAVVYFLPGELDINGDDDDDDDAAPSWNRIAAFDLESEEWKAEVINGPTLERKEGELWASIALVELKGTLGLVHEVYDVNNYAYTSIWLLTDPNKSVWVKEYNMIPMPKNQLQHTELLGALLDGRILLLSSVWEIEGTTGCQISRDIVLFYDPRTKAFTNSVEVPDKECRFALVFYTGSLL